MLTIYLSVGGGSGLLKIAFILLRHRKSPNYESLDDIDEGGDVSSDAVLSRSIKFTDFILNIFILVWFILGNVWYYAKPKPNFVQILHEPNNWCDAFLYRYYFYTLIISYILFSFILFYVITLCYYYYRQNGLRFCKPRLVIWMYWVYEWSCSSSAFQHDIHDGYFHLISMYMYYESPGRVVGRSFIRVTKNSIYSFTTPEVTKLRIAWRSWRRWRRFQWCGFVSLN